MRIEFTYSRGPDYFRRQLRPAGMKIVGIMLVHAALFGVCGFAAVWAAEGEGVPAIVGGLIGLLSVGYVLQTFRVYRAAVRVPEAWTAPRTYTISDEDIEASTALSSTRWAWKAVRSADVTPAAFVLWLEGGGFIDIPRAPLSELDEAELHARVGAL